MYNVSILLIPLYIIITIYYIGSRRGGIVSGILIILVAILWGLLFLTQLYIPVNWIVLVTMYVLEAIILLNHICSTIYTVDNTDNNINTNSTIPTQNSRHTNNITYNPHSIHRSIDTNTTNLWIKKEEA